jgi:lipoprotein-releasing system permease protein
LNLFYFISKRISKAEKSSFSATIHTVSVASIALGLATMIMSFLILFGFKSTIREKLVSFGAHFQITRFSLASSYERDPISINEVFLSNEKPDFIEHVQSYAYKAGLLRTEEEVYGVLLKGVGEDFALDRFSQNMVAGQFVQFPDSGYSNDVVMSRKIANALQLDTGDNVVIVFIQDDGRARFRRLDIRGIYDTGMEEFDDRIILGDIKMIQRLNDWPDTLVGGVEVFIRDYGQIDEAEELLFDEVGYNLYVEKVTDQYREVFDWLALINQNVYIFLAIILGVACFNMISALLILIMERTQMIGILKAVGATNKQIRSIFMSNGLLLIGKGLLFGNIIGIGLGALQYYFRIIPLDPENYYMSFVPIEWNFLTIFLLNFLTLLVVGGALMIPTFILSRVSPIKSIRFD